MPEIPDAANQIVEFLNSRGVGFSAGVDQLEDPARALKLCRLFDPSVKEVDARSLARLRQLRDALVGILEPSSSKKSRAHLQSLASTASFKLNFSRPGEATWSPETGNLVLSRILLGVAELINRGEWDRLKHCANHACSATFFDVSRSKTQRWHSYAICGNKNNVAAFRSRQA